MTSSQLRLRSRNRSRSLRLAPVYIVLSVLGLLMIVPFLWQIVASLSTIGEVTATPPVLIPAKLIFSNYQQALASTPFLGELLVSISSTVLRVAGQLTVCSLAGYAFARMDFPFKRVALGAVLAIMMIPYQVYILPQYQIIQSLGLLNSVLGIALPGMFGAFGTFMMMQFFRTLPHELEDAARLDGCNPWQIFWRVMLPLSKPGLSALAVLTVLWSWNDLLWPLVVGTNLDATTLSVGVASLQGQQFQNYPVILAASLLAMLPILIGFIFFQRRVISGIAFSGMK
jgi:multiple sugar transport system permease protein